MPIALWTGSSINTEIVDSSLIDSPLSSLPERIRAWRKQTIITGEKEITRKRLTLLWDDPNQLPPTLLKKPCKAPGKAKGM